MGVASDLLTNMAAKLREGFTVKEFLDQLVADGKDTVITSDTDVVTEIQTMDITGGTSGTFDLDVTVAGETASLSSVAYNVNAATLQSALDSAADGNITDYTAGDIAVACASTADAAVVTFTMGGVALGATNVLTLDDASVGGSPVGTAGVTTAYNGTRPAYALLKALGVISGTAPAFGVVPTTEFTAPGPGANAAHYPPQPVIEALIEEINATEGIDAFPYFEYLLGVQFTRQG